MSLEQERLNPTEPQSSDGFPEPVADFVYVDPESNQTETRRLTLGELKKKIRETSYNLRQAQQDSIGSIPERKHWGGLVSERERRDIRRQRRRQGADEPKQVIRKLKTRLEMFQQKRNVIFSSDPDKPLRIEIEDGTLKIVGEPLPLEETTWRKFLDDTGFRSLWSHPQIRTVRQAFVLRQAVKEAEQSANREAEVAARRNFEEFKKTAPEIPPALRPLMNKIGERFPVP